MPSFCKNCNRPKGPPHHIFGICDTVRLSDGRTVHRQRIELGGDLQFAIGDDLKVVHRNVTSEMREQHRKEQKKKDRQKDG